MTTDLIKDASRLLEHVPKSDLLNIPNYREMDNLGFSKIMDEIKEKISKKGAEHLDMIFEKIVGEEMFNSILNGKIPKGLKVEKLETPDKDYFTIEGAKFPSGTTFFTLNEKRIGIMYPQEMKIEGGKTSFYCKYWSKREEIII